MLVISVVSAAYCIWVQYGTIDELREAFYDLIHSIKGGDLCNFYYTTFKCYNIIHQCHQLWTHLFCIYGSRNFRVPNCHIKHSAIRILRSFLTHITRWICYFQCTGIANVAFTPQATQSTSHQEFLCPIERTNWGKNQPNFWLLGLTAATCQLLFFSLLTWFHED